MDNEQDRDNHEAQLGNGAKVQDELVGSKEHAGLADAYSIAPSDFEPGIR